MNSNTVVSGTIYGLHNGDGNIRYIGYTAQDPHHRLIKHRSDARRSDKPRHVFRWIMKHGPDNIHMDILEYYPDIYLDDLKIREIIRIAQGRLEGLDLVNGTDGGDDVPQTPEIRAKISIANTGKKRTPEQKANIPTLFSAGNEPWNKGKSFTDEHKLNLSIAQIGKKHSEESKAKRSASLKGKPPTRGNHEYWHVKMGRLPKKRCEWCLAEAEVQNEVSLTS